MSLNDWKAIQRKVGAKPVDGIPGPATARAVKKALDIVTAPMGPLVKGTGKNIRKVFIHCTATQEGKDFDAATIKRWHLSQGWKDIGYHFVIRLNGDVELGRPEHQTGSHVRGHNTGSIGVVYVGGVDKAGKPKDTRTPEQKAAMAKLVKQLVAVYPGAKVLGHRDAPAAKACPSFDVRSWWAGVK